MHLCLVAVNPTDAVTEGFLAAAANLDFDVTVLTDDPDAHRQAYADLPYGPEAIVRCDVRNVHDLIATATSLPTIDVVFSNSDHLQTQTALLAEYLGLPGKDWRVTTRVKNKALMRRHLRDAGVSPIAFAELASGVDCDLSGFPYPAVLKPREGVASEDVFYVSDNQELHDRRTEIEERRPHATLLLEEFIPGALHTIETMGDGTNLEVIGGFTTSLSPLPVFVEQRVSSAPALPAMLERQILDQLAALGVGLGICHTEFVVDGDRANVIEVNYRAIGDECDFLLADLLGIPLFEHVLRLHAGEPLQSATLREARRRSLTRYGVVDPVITTKPGILRFAPGRTDLVIDDARVAYRPVQSVGSDVIHLGSNRDYVGLIRVIGPDTFSVDSAISTFRSTNHWDIE